MRLITVATTALIVCIVVVPITAKPQPHGAVSLDARDPGRDRDQDWDDAGRDWNDDEDDDDDQDDQNWDNTPRPDPCVLELYQDWQNAARFCNRWTASAKSTAGPNAIPDWLRRPCNRDPLYVSKACSTFLPGKGEGNGPVSTVTTTVTASAVCVTPSVAPPRSPFRSSAIASLAPGKSSAAASAPASYGRSSAIQSAYSSPLASFASTKSSATVSLGLNKSSAPASLAASPSSVASSRSASGSLAPASASVSKLSSIMSIISPSASRTSSLLLESCKPVTVTASGSCSVSTVTISASPVSYVTTVASACPSFSRVAASSAFASLSASRPPLASASPSTSAVCKQEGYHAGFGLDPFYPTVYGKGAFWTQTDRGNTAGEGHWVFEVSISPGLESSSSIGLSTINAIEVTSGVDYQVSFLARVSNAANKCTIYARVTDSSGISILNDNLWDINNDFQFQKYTLDFNSRSENAIRQDFLFRCSQANNFPIIQFDAADLRRK